MDDTFLAMRKKKTGDVAANNLPNTDTAHKLSQALLDSDHEEAGAQEDMDQKFKRIKQYMSED